MLSGNSMLYLLIVALVVPAYVSGESIYTCGSYTGDNVYYQLKAPLLLFNPKDHPVACLNFKGTNIVVDGMGASIICTAANCVSRGIMAEATNALLTNFKLVGTGGVLAKGDNITVDGAKFMTVFSSALEIHTTTSATLRNNNIVNAENGGVVVKVDSKANNNMVVIEDNFFVGVTNPVHVINGVGKTIVTRNNIVDSVGSHVIAVVGTNNEVIIEDNFVAAFAGEQGIIAEGVSTTVVDNQLLDCNITSANGQATNKLAKETDLLPSRMGEQTITDASNNTNMGLKVVVKSANKYWAITQHLLSYLHI